ncbi:hypothetical protein LCGC14_1278930 [marine sediment metagenome]|uniref:Uncharacterized protein n=1 Tax=marine sediment metagenome TaxID=412755 RepID=A0A0F9KVQ7_9ZZZZ
MNPEDITVEVKKGWLQKYLRAMMIYGQCILWVRKKDE